MLQVAPALLPLMGSAPTPAQTDPLLDDPSDSEDAADPGATPAVAATPPASPPDSPIVLETKQFVASLAWWDSVSWDTILQLETDHRAGP